MALCQLVKLGHLSNRGLLQSKTHITNRVPKSVRNFKRIKEGEDLKPAFDSVASPFTNVVPKPGDIKIGLLWKPFGFTCVFSGFCFGGAAIWQYENLRAHALTMLKKPYSLLQKQGELRKEINRWWNNLTPGERVFAPICALNILVFAAWRIPRLQPFMLKYFCSNPGGAARCWPMLLSTFSHYSIFHLMANMYVLHSFSSGAVAALGKEQFLGLYLSAGVISSFTSYIYKVITKQPGLSLGASGAIMAILGYVCMQYPDTKLGIILLPFLTFSAGSAIKVIVALDATGCILRWKVFDHAAHLGGAICGVTWALWGNQYLWQKRDPILQYWHELRGAIK